MKKVILLIIYFFSMNLLFPKNEYWGMYDIKSKVSISWIEDDRSRIPIKILFKDRIKK